MGEQTVYSLIKIILPGIAENLLNKLNLFRLFKIQLPESTNQEELFSEIKKMPDEYKLWKIVKEVSDSNEKYFFVTFFNKKRYYLFNPNWPQFTTVIYKEINLLEKYLIVYSQFSKTQVAERGVLMKNCNIVIEVIKKYFKKHGIDISQNIKKAEFLKDSISSSIYGKNISTKQIILSLLIVFIILMLIFFYIITH